VRAKFAGVLDYFGEETTMAPHDFFATLSKFIMVFSFFNTVIALFLLSFLTCFVYYNLFVGVLGDSGQGGAHA
jgi:hypothetical protein